MSNLNTKYLGFNLKSPLIVSSSGLTDNIDKLKAAEDNMAGAVVLKSLFEEQINHQAGSLHTTSDYPEATDYINSYTKSHSLDLYLNLISQAKKSLDIPIIPSINCITSDDWISFAKSIEGAGADALEINVFFLPLDKKMSAFEAEKLYFTLIEKLKKSISIPIVLKLGQRFSNLLNLVDQFYNRGVEGVVLFNRFYEPDIDINSLNITPASVFSSPEDKRYVLRWIGMIDSIVPKIDIAASTGVHTGHDAVKYLLAGADAVQVCSILYRNGIEYLSEMNEMIKVWMEQKEFKSISDFRGKLNYSNISEPTRYERAQFMKYFSSYE
jgi:dihydroorotate dehydrogenase (fumarate)